MVNIALGSAEESTCEAADTNGDEEVTIDEILSGVNKALNGCAASIAIPLDLIEPDLL